MTSFLNPPSFAGYTVPGFTASMLSEDEQALVARLQSVAWQERSQMELCNAYYAGEQAMTSLGIAIPRELDGLRAVLGWPTKAVDPLVDRLALEGFRLPGATDADPGLLDIWSGNDMGAESALVHTDALALGAGWVTIGDSDEPGGLPVIRAESPLNMSALWDARTKRLRAVLQVYWEDGGRHAVLYVPGQSIYLDTDENNQWHLTRRDDHGYAGIPVVRFTNRPRTHARDGESEITPAIRNITDAACRTIIQMQVGGEIYSLPKLLLLGATENDFRDAQGNLKTTWQTYITRMLALERNDDGELPSVTQLQAYDPSVFTKVLDWYAAQMTAHIAATPQDLGLYTEGNPPSADSVQFADSRRDRLALTKHSLFSGSWVQVMQHAVQMANRGKLPADMRRMEVDWRPPSLPSPSVMGPFLQQLISAGAIPATSDVTLKRAGFSAVERAQLAQDRDASAGDELLRRLADQVGSQNAAQVSSDGTDQTGQ